MLAPLCCPKEDARMQTIPMKNKRKGLALFVHQLKENRLLLLMILPAVVFFGFFCYAPMGGLVLAFKKYDYSLGMFGSPWTGFKNFEFLFKSGKLVTLFSNTMLYNIAFILVNLALELLIAIVLSELSGKYYKKFCQTMVFLPYFVSMVVVGSITYNLLNYKYGFINNLIDALGGKRINFYATPDAWPVILVLLNAWKGIGYGSVVYLAAVTGIDAEIHEAARIDGANIVQRLWYITLPCLIPTIITMTLLKLGGVFKGNFDLFWNTIGQNSLLFKTTDVIDTYIYRSMLKGSDYGMTTAAGMLQSIMCFLMIMIVNGAVKKISPDNALF